MEPLVIESVRYTEPCGACGARMKCVGTQTLVDGRLRWDVEWSCVSCGSIAAACGGDMPAARRKQMLAAYGPTRLRVDGLVTAGDRVVALRVLRKALDLDLTGAKAKLSAVLAGDVTGTRPEVEWLARRLRGAGVAAEAVPPQEERSDRA
ncbi:hypothetical protein [Streptomyces sp. NPDC020917]|uniref:hypothetical protein n=1 Tax=Streptomyces sp. NPDC020917 TaxID=3365102 RepID=UPI00378A53BE